MLALHEGRGATLLRGVHERGHHSQLVISGGPAASGDTTFRVGVLSDTHGHLYTSVREVLHGVDAIVHAGDVGSPDVLRGLAEIAPLTAVRGNCDFGDWADELPARASVQLGGVRFIVIHRRLELGGEGAGKQAIAGMPVVVYGHTHVASIRWVEETLLLNPGAAGPRRFGLPRTVAIVEIERGRLRPDVIVAE